MPEREPKFSKAEIAQKQEEAQKMDKQAEEMIEKGEAKTPQEAIEKIEAKELEKSPEEMLKEALPLAWEEALKFAQEKGFATPAEIKKRIDLAKKYNLELEHFFYGPERLGKHLPIREQIEKTATEMFYVSEFSQALSQENKKPVYAIFNARNGTIYSYGLDTIGTQLNKQFKKIVDKEGRTVQELRDEFSQDLKQNKYWRENKKVALINTVQKWIKEGKLENLVVPETNFKMSSFWGVVYEGKVPLIREKSYAKELFIDASVGDWPDAGYRRDATRYGEEELERFPQTMSSRGGFITNTNKIEGRTEKKGKDNPNFTFTNEYFLKKKRDLKKEILEEARRKPYIEGLNPVFTFGHFSSEEDIWFENWPQVLGKRGKKFGHIAHGGYSFPTEKIVQSAQRVEYLSEKVKNALRYEQRDEQGRNWFERNFEGIMLGKEKAPEKGTKEYLAMFRKWVPYETDEKGEAVLDNKGYPIPRETAPMTVAAEDELTRLEAAMEELEGQER